MLYLTLCDKISQNLALLKVDSPKLFKSHRIFRPSKSTFYKEIITNYKLVCVFFCNKFFTLKQKLFGYFGGVPKSVLCKSPLQFWFISQISVHSLWHICYCSLQIKQCTNSVDQNQTSRLIQTVLHSNGIPERTNLKLYGLKNG